MNEFQQLRDKVMQVVTIQQHAEVKAEVEKLFNQLPPDATSEKEQLNKLLAELAKKEPQLVKTSESESARSLVSQGKYSEAIQAIGIASQRGPLDNDNVSLLRTIFKYDPNTSSQVLELLNAIPNQRRTADVQKLLTELTPFQDKKQAQQEPAVHPGPHTPSEPGRAGSFETQKKEENMSTDNAEEIMQQADALFYSGKFTEAALLYRRAADLGKKRAEDRLRDIETGNLPEGLIPAEVGVLYGRALSVFRRGNYPEATRLTDEAAEKLGGIVWKPLSDLRDRAFAAQQAEEAFMDGKELEAQGRFQEAIPSYDAAISLNLDPPKYKEAAEESKKAAALVNEIKASLKEAKTVQGAEALLAGSERIDELERLRPGNPVVAQLRAQYQNITPRSANYLNSEARALLDKDHKSIDAALEDTREAIEMCKMAEKLGGTGAVMADAEQQLKTLTASKAEISARPPSLWNYFAMRSYARETDELKDKFPDDLGVKSRERNLATYRSLSSFLKFGLVAAVILIALTICVSGIRNRGMIVAYFKTPMPTITLTPTLTQTMTPTFTSTLEPTSTFTPTSTTTFTPTLTLTPTPVTPSPTPIVYMFASKTIFLRERCYYDYRALATIPQGSRVKILVGTDAGIVDESLGDKPPCVFVQYGEGGSSVLGYLLWRDLQP